jgi:hypothetical protein
MLEQWFKETIVNWRRLLLNFSKATQSAEFGYRKIGRMIPDSRLLERENLDRYSW